MTLESKEKLKFLKNVNNNKHAPKIIFFNKNIRNIQIIFDTLTLNVRNRHFSILNLEHMLIYQKTFSKLRKCYLKFNQATI